MTTIDYDPARGFSRPQPARRARLRLNDRPHPKGGTSHQGSTWVAARRVHQAQLKALHTLCDARVKVDAESVGLEIITFLHELDPQSLHLLRADFAAYWRLSNR
jgi:hypothetical protein